MDEESKQLLSQIRDNTHTLYYYDVGEHLKHIDEQMSAIINFLWILLILMCFRNIREWYANRDK